MKTSAYLLCTALAVLPAAMPVARAEDDSRSVIPAQAYVHPQTLVMLRSGRRMNLFCTGHGTPAVVFEAGLGASAFTWRHVQGPVSASTRACSYDRAGYGFSDPSNRASDARDTVDDLHDLLAAAGVAMPVVLVGHSIGGLYDTLYAETYPHDVAGMVLVDPSVAHQDDAFTSGTTPKQKAALQVSRNKLLAMSVTVLRSPAAASFPGRSNRALPASTTRRMPIPFFIAS